MRVAQVIGRVTLSIQDPSFKGGRWLMVNPLDAEATAPFDFPIPIDAITVAIFDSLSYQPPLSDS